MHIKKFEFTIFLVSLSVGFLSFMFTIYAKSLGLSAIEISWLFSLFSVIQLIVRPVVGLLIDRYGRKIFLISACLLYAGSMVTYAFTTSADLLILSRVLQAFGAAVFGLTIQVIAVDLSTQKTRPFIMGRVVAASQKAALFGTFIGFVSIGYYLFEIGWQIAFLVYGVASLLAAIYTLFQFKETRDETTCTQNNKPLKLTPLLTLVLTIVFIRALASSFIAPIFIIYLQDSLQIEIYTLALALLPSALIHSFFPIKASKVVDYYGRKRVFLFGISLSIAVTLLIVRTTTLEFFIGLWVVEAIGLVMSTVAFSSLLGDVVGKNRLGKQYGIILFVSGIGSIIGPLIGGYSYDTVSKTSPFYLYAALMLIVVFIAWFIPNKIEKYQIAEK